MLEDNYIVGTLLDDLGKLGVISRVIKSGSMDIEMEHETVHLSEGEMYVVPKGVMHKPYAETECHVMLVEPRGVVNTGDTGGELTAENDVWV